MCSAKFTFESGIYCLWILARLGFYGNICVTAFAIDPGGNCAIVFTGEVNVKECNGVILLFFTGKSDEPFDSSNFEVIKTMTGKNKRKLDYDLKVWEALEIKKANCGPGRGMNEDWGSYVKTDAWNPVFNTMD